MRGFVDDIEELAEENDDFRHVLYPGKHLQLVLMSLKPGEEIGDEIGTLALSRHSLEEPNFQVFYNLAMQDRDK